MFIKNFPLTFMNVTLFNNFLVTSLTFFLAAFMLLYTYYCYSDAIFSYSDFIATAILSPAAHASGLSFHVLCPPQMIQNDWGRRRRIHGEALAEWIQARALGWSGGFALIGGHLLDFIVDDLVLAAPGSS